MNILTALHQFCRPHRSQTEARFIDQYIRPYADPDVHGNYHRVIGKSQILWSCHIDTTPCFPFEHKPKRKWKRSFRRQDVQGGIKHQLFVEHGMLKAHNSHCGADDSAGVFLCLEMIKRKIPGHYVFHRGEEVGCIGSSAIALEHPTWIDHIQYAIAFDRRGTSDVITHQAFGRTASDQFAESLADQLNPFGFMYRPSDRGLFTDTYQYSHLIPECSNISVGYSGEHGSSEQLDTGHVFKLLDALCHVKESDLLCKRDPADQDEVEFWGYGTYGNQSFSMFQCSECQMYFGYDRYGCTINGQPICQGCTWGESYGKLPLG